MEQNKFPKYKHGAFQKFTGICTDPEFQQCYKWSPQLMKGVLGLIMFHYEYRLRYVQRQDG